MKHCPITKLYLKYIIEPLEIIVKNPDFTTQYSKEEQQTLNKLLLHHYQELEDIMKDKI